MQYLFFFFLYNYNNISPILTQIKIILDETLEKLPDAFNMMELMGKVEPADRTPYVVVAFQECERMNFLTGEIRFVFIFTSIKRFVALQLVKSR